MTAHTQPIPPGPGAERARLLHEGPEGQVS